MTTRILFTVLSLWAISGWTSLAFAAASPVVYQSSDPGGINPGTPYALSYPTESLELYYSPGPTPTSSGTTCLNGNGDEICGITIVIQPSGDVVFDSFAADLTNDLIVNFSPPSTLVINRLNGTTGDTGPVRLGILYVSLGVVGGAISVAPSSPTPPSSQAIGASLQTLTVADNDPIAVPEPWPGEMLLVGTLVIAAAYEFRRARATQRASIGHGIAGSRENLDESTSW